jgi:predicted PurR-regulated permease PerM
VNMGKWIGLLALIASLYILWEIRQILLLVFAAVVLANSLNLLAQRLQKMGIKRSGAVLLSVLLMLIALVVFFWLIVPPFARQFQELFVLVPRGGEELNSKIEEWMVRLVPAPFRPYVPSIESLEQQSQPLINRLLSESFAFFSSSLGNILNILLVVVLSLMLLVNPLAYRRGFIRLFPAFYRQRVDMILSECETALGRWIVGALISMGVVAIFSTIGLMLIGVPAALAQGILSGLLNFIPNIGPTFSVVPPMLISLLDPHTPLLKALLVLGLYVLIQQLESNLLTPYVMAQQVSLLPALTLLGQVFFATIFGFLGLLLAIPLMVVFQIWVRKVLVEDILDHWDSPTLAHSITGPADNNSRSPVTEELGADSKPVSQERTINPEISDASQ